MISPQEKARLEKIKKQRKGKEEWRNFLELFEEPLLARGWFEAEYERVLSWEKGVNLVAENIGVTVEESKVTSEKLIARVLQDIKFANDNLVSGSKSLLIISKNIEKYPVLAHAYAQHIIKTQEANK